MRASFFKPLCLLMFLCALAVPLAHPQAQTQAQTKSQPQDELDKVPDEYIEEAHNYFNFCTQSYMDDNYYNCACLSSALLRERIDRGPLATKEVILMSIREECFDAINSAGPTYEKCLRRAGTFEPGTDPEKYCECVANTYVKALNFHKPVMRSSAIVRFTVYAYTKCNDPRTPMPPG